MLLNTSIAEYMLRDSAQYKFTIDNDIHDTFRKLRHYIFTCEKHISTELLAEAANNSQSYSFV